MATTQPPPPNKQKKLRATSSTPYLFVFQRVVLMMQKPIWYATYTKTSSDALTTCCFTSSCDQEFFPPGDIFKFRLPKTITRGLYSVQWREDEVSGSVCVLNLNNRILVRGTTIAASIHPISKYSLVAVGVAPTVAAAA